MKLPVLAIIKTDGYYCGYYYDDIQQYIHYYDNKNKIILVDKVLHNIYNNINKYIVVYNDHKIINKIYVRDKQVEYVKQSNDIYTIVYKNIKYYIYSNDRGNLYRCIKYEVICPDIDERIEYLKNNNLFNNLKLLLCNKS